MKLNLTWRFSSASRRASRLRISWSVALRTAYRSSSGEKGLGRKSYAPKLGGLHGGLEGRVRRDHDRQHALSLPAQLREQVQAAHAGQFQIEEQQIELVSAVPALEELLPRQEVGAVESHVHAHILHVDPVLAEDPLHRQAQGLLVVHDGHPEELFVGGHISVLVAVDQAEFGLVGRSPSLPRGGAGSR